MEPGSGTKYTKMHHPTNAKLESTRATLCFGCLLNHHVSSSPMFISLSTKYTKYTPIADLCHAMDAMVPTAVNCTPLCYYCAMSKVSTLCYSNPEICMPTPHAHGMVGRWHFHALQLEQGSWMIVLTGNLKPAFPRATNKFPIEACAVISCRIYSQRAFLGHG